MTMSILKGLGISLAVVFVFFIITRIFQAKGKGKGGNSYGFWDLFKVLLALGVLVITGTCGVKMVRSAQNEWNPEPITVINHYTLPAGTPAAQNPTPVSYGKNMTPYYFEGGNHCFNVSITSDADIYPKGGTITICPPEGKPCWDSTPGVDSSESGKNKPSGTYRMCKKNPSATGAEIFQ